MFRTSKLSEHNVGLLLTENYGQSGIQAFRELAERANICIAKEDAVLSNAEEEEFERTVRKLSQDENARVVVCFCEGMTVRGLLAATARLNLTGRFIFLGRYLLYTYTCPASLSQPRNFHPTETPLFGPHRIQTNYYQP